MVYKMQPRWEVELQGYAFSICTVLCLYCYAACIVTCPGLIPDDADKMWRHVSGNGRWLLPQQPITQEAKRSGERRLCKWCAKYKPDRCHHCRVCRTCILKMDHHCPWVANCIGFKNYKYFFLFIFYVNIDLYLVAYGMYGKVGESVEKDVPFVQLFNVLFVETLAIFIAVLTSLFFAFHVWLMIKGMTTIELCEKTSKSVAYTSIYGRGVLNNVKEVLGNNVLFWFLPIKPPVGDGTDFFVKGAVSDERPVV